MLKANKKGELVEFSLKQREQWMLYQKGIEDNRLPKFNRAQLPFLEVFPTRSISAPPFKKGS